MSGSHRAPAPAEMFTRGRTVRPAQAIELALISMTVLMTAVLLMGFESFVILLIYLAVMAMIGLMD
ncbi:MAG: hypothetical protein ABEK03_10435 [Candidatus Bipolaricaulia bacterium]